MQWKHAIRDFFFKKNNKKKLLNSSDNANMNLIEKLVSFYKIHESL